MSGLTVRYTMAGMASTTGIALLGLALFSNPAAIVVRLWPSQPASGVAEVIQERDALMQERNALRQQAADLASQLDQMATKAAKAREPQVQPQKTADVAPATPHPSRAPGPTDAQSGKAPAPITAPFEKQMTAPAMPAAPVGSLHERLERAEISLVEARPQQAEQLLESILFELTFRPVPGSRNPTAPSAIVQALGAVAAADLEKAAFYAEMARPDL